MSGLQLIQIISCATGLCVLVLQHFIHVW